MYPLYSCTAMCNIIQDNVCFSENPINLKHFSPPVSQNSCTSFRPVISIAICYFARYADIMSTRLYRKRFCRTDIISNRQNVDRQDVEQTKCRQTQCRTDIMSNRQNVEQTKCRTDKMSNRHNVEQT